MKPFFRILILFLCFLLAIPLTGCKSGNGEDQESSTQTEGESDYLDSLPKNTYGIEEFRITTIDTNCIPNTLDETATRVESALFTRDTKIMEYYDVDIVYTEIPIEAADIMYNRIAADEINGNAFIQTAQNLMSVAVKGGLSNLNDVSNLNLSNEWWNQSLNDNLVLNNALYIAAGPISQWYYGAAIAMAYNKQMAHNLGCDDIQSSVQGGDWTLERMYEICVNGNITEDLNDNTILDVNDRYSISIAKTILYGVFASVGGNFSTLDEEGGLHVELGNLQTVDRLDELVKVFNADTSYYGSVASSKEVFITNRSLFWLTGTGYLDQLVPTEIDYGIIPCPKYNAQQSEYISCAWPISNYCLGIPSTLSADEKAFLGLMMEAYCYVSHQLVRPAKWETVMKSQVAADPESSENLDLIFNSLYFDINLVLDLGGSRTLIYNTILDGSTGGLTRGLQAISGRIKDDINALVVRSMDDTQTNE